MTLVIDKNNINILDHDTPGGPVIREAEFQRDGAELYRLGLRLLEAFGPEHVRYAIPERRKAVGP